MPSPLLPTLASCHLLFSLCLIPKVFLGLRDNELTAVFQPYQVYFFCIHWFPYFLFSFARKTFISPLSLSSSLLLVVLSLTMKVSLHPKLLLHPAHKLYLCFMYLFIYFCTKISIARILTYLPLILNGWRLSFCPKNIRPFSKYCVYL